MWEMQERPYARLSYIQAPWSRVKTLSSYVRMKDILSVKDIRDNEDLIGHYGTDPATLVYVDISYVDVVGSSTPVSITCLFTISFFIECFNLADVADS